MILGLGDPHGLEGRQGRQDGATDPDEELSLLRSQDLDLHGRGSKSSHFLLESFGNAWEHSGSTAHDDIAIEILADVDVALKDGLIGNFVEARHFLADGHGLEQSFRASEFLTTNIDGLSVR